MKKKTNYEIGDEIKINEKTNKVINGYAETIESLRNSMADMSKVIYDNKKDMFKTIHEKYPELKGYEFTLVHKDNVIRVGCKK